MILKVIFANSVDPDQTAESDQGPHSLPVCKNRFEKYARVISRQHKQMTFSDAGFPGILRVEKQSELIIFGPDTSNEYRQCMLSWRQKRKNCQ